MEDWVMRIADDLVDRISGPFRFRLVLQPIMAAAFAIAAGLKDAKAGSAPYLWGLLTGTAQRTDMLKQGWKDISRIFLFAVVLDVLYQMVVLRFVYPLEVVIVAFVLAIVPYLIVRGLVTRIAR